MHEMPTPPEEDSQDLKDLKPTLSRKDYKNSKQSYRVSKRTVADHEHNSTVLDGRHKRVWKACERCRMKKTKCDGESPCKRCKDDGLVCTAGSRKKTEFKQLPRGYAEVLENTQYALIAAVHKLYAMVRAGDKWDKDEPELNERGQPVIHDIASILGCIRASPDTPLEFPEGPEDFARLQASLQASRREMGSHDEMSRKLSSDGSSYSPAPGRLDRAGSSDTDHSGFSSNHNKQMDFTPAAKLTPLNIKPAPYYAPSALPNFYSNNDDVYAQMSLNSPSSLPESPSTFPEYQNRSPSFENNPPAAWGALSGDEFLTNSHQLASFGQFLSRPNNGLQTPLPLAQSTGYNAGGFKNNTQLQTGMDISDGTIQPAMLFSDSFQEPNYSSDYLDAFDMSFNTRR